MIRDLRLIRSFSRHGNGKSVRSLCEKGCKHQSFSFSGISTPSCLQLNRSFSGTPGTNNTHDLSEDSVPRYPNILALPVVSQPIFPSRPKVIILRDQETISAIEKVGYVGVFLRKSSPKGGAEGNTSSDKPEIITDPNDLYTVGTFCKLQKMNYPDSHHPRQDQPFVEAADPDNLATASQSYWLMGKRRIDLRSIISLGPPIDVTVSHWDQPEYVVNDTIRALANEVLSIMRELSRESALFRESMSWFPSRVDASDPFRLADFCASTVTQANPEDLQAVLQEVDPELRLQKALSLLQRDKDVAKIQVEIVSRVGLANAELNQKHFLRQQLNVIKDMLSIDSEKEIFLKARRQQLSEWPAVPEFIRGVIEKEMVRFETMEANSSELTVSRSYLEWLCSLPWGKMTSDNFDLRVAREILDRDHYGMDDVKDTILQFIAVGKLKGSIQGKIICLVGPPGVGKTSIAKGIAEALGREFFRFSVGGLSDVNEVTGHRRTYIGALPGKLIQGLKLAGSMNPLVVIDEIDKISDGYRGTPSHALLEALDPNQNSSFVDHYLDVPVDMSKVLFVCTANTSDSIPGPLLDRMEIFSLSGYDFTEKVAIAERFLIPKSMEECGLTSKKESVHATDDATHEKDAEGMNVNSESEAVTCASHLPESLTIDRSAIESLVRWYARETGVRNLSKYVNKITRKLALQLVAENEGADLSDNCSRKSDSWTVTKDNLADYVGKPEYTNDRMYETEHLPNGIVTGLAYTVLGGSMLYIETQAIRRGYDENNKRRSGGNLKVTGKLGEVMVESSSIAYTVARARLAQVAPDSNYFDENDIHLHVPEGATPKDGPSAGVTMVTSMLSLALAMPVRSDLAMTGEISLTGKVMRIGGVKEKVMAARRSGITTIVLPTTNKRDWDELASYLKEGVEVHFAEDYDAIYKIAFSPDPMK